MGMQCPNCKSTNIHTRNIGKKAGGCVGTTTASVAGVNAALTAARVSSLAPLGIIAGPGGLALSTLATAIFAGVSAGILGGSAGAALGQVVDKNILDNFECLRCGYRFSDDNDDSDAIALPTTDWRELIDED